MIDSRGSSASMNWLSDGSSWLASGSDAAASVIELVGGAAVIDEATPLRKIILKAMDR